MVFCNKNTHLPSTPLLEVTILILIDGFLQYMQLRLTISDFESHNPYFNRWFSAIKVNDIDNQIMNESQSLF